MKSSGVDGSGDISELSEKMYALNVLPEDGPYSPMSPPSAPMELLRKNAFLHDGVSTPEMPRPCATPLRNEGEGQVAHFMALGASEEMSKAGQVELTAEEDAAVPVPADVLDGDRKSEVLALGALLEANPHAGAVEVWRAAAQAEGEVAVAGEVVQPGEDAGTSQVAVAVAGEVVPAADAAMSEAAPPDQGAAAGEVVPPAALVIEAVLPGEVVSPPEDAPPPAQAVERAEDAPAGGEVVLPAEDAPPGEALQPAVPVEPAVEPAGDGPGGQAALPAVQAVDAVQWTKTTLIKKLNSAAWLLE